MEQIADRRELLMVIAGGKMYTYEDILALPEGERCGGVLDRGSGKGASERVPFSGK